MAEIDGADIIEKKAPKPSSGHVEVLDGLRGLAILLVMLLHTWQISWLDFQSILPRQIFFQPLAETGFFGVDLFFFLSAFCLALPYARNLQAGIAPPTVKHFFLRRVAKIIPSYWLLLAVLLYCFPHPDVPLDRFWVHLGTHVLFIHNFFFETSGSLNGVLWSLAVEVQFYFLFPLLMVGFRKWPIVTAIAMVCTAEWWHWTILSWYKQDGAIVFLDWHDLQLPSFLDMFAAGIVGAFVYTALSANPKVRKWAPVFTGVAILGFVAFYLEMCSCYYLRDLHLPARLWQVQYRLLLALTFLAIGVSSALSMQWFRRALANPVLRFFSLISYNLYLWHQWIARWMLEHRIPAPATQDPHSDPHWQAVYMLSSWGAATAVATILTLVWERPFLRANRGWLDMIATARRNAVPMLQKVRHDIAPTLRSFVAPFRLSARERGLVAFVLLLKVILLIMGIVCQDVYHNGEIHLPIGLITLWNRWDSPHYLYIAQYGYKPNGNQQNLLAFFFGYPILIALGMRLGISAVESGFLVSTIASLFVAVTLFRLAKLDGNAASAHRAVWFQFIFPTAYFLHLDTTESTFLAFTLAAFLAARERRWSTAGILGIAGACTRMNGLLIVPGLLAEAWSEWRETRKFNVDWLFALLPALGTALYLHINYYISGDPLMFLRYQRENWHHRLDFPWHGIYNSFQFSIEASGNTAQMIGTQEFIFAILGLVFTIACVATMRPSYAVWALGNFLLITSMDFITSTPRYMLLFFPMFILWGKITKHRPYFYAFTACCLLFYGLFAPIYMQGGWAF